MRSPSPCFPRSLRCAWSLGLVIGATGAHLASRAIARATGEVGGGVRTLDDREAFLAMLSAATDIEAGRPSGLTIALVNLRAFRAINETLGPAAGDRLLRCFAANLAAAAPSDATVARLGGDEFGVAVRGAQAWEGASDVVTQALRGLDVDGRTVALDATVGVAHWPLDVPSSDQLLEGADLAMAAASGAAGTRVVRYDEAVATAARRRRRIASDLRGAVEHGEVDVVFQPLVELRTERVVGVEALVRWDHPEFGLVPPAEFVAVAEETGQVQLLTDHALEQGCRQAAAWDEQRRDLGLSVNISAHDLEGDALPERVSAVLARHGLSPDRLTLELTETSMMRDPDHSTAVIAALARRGVGVAIDDFGTGHSSLAYLASLAVSKVKIDRAFVREVVSSEQSQLVVRAVVGLAASRGLGVVAEGIEDRQTFETLRELGVDVGQGHLTGRPGPAADVPDTRMPSDG